MSISALGSFRAAKLGRQAVQRRRYHTDRPREMGAREKHGYLASLLLSEGNEFAQIPFTGTQAYSYLLSVSLQGVDT